MFTVENSEYYLDEECDILNKSFNECFFFLCFVSEYNFITCSSEIFIAWSLGLISSKRRIESVVILCMHGVVINCSGASCEISVGTTYNISWKKFYCLAYFTFYKLI
jgi:hypothetical protein